MGLAVGGPPEDDVTGCPPTPDATCDLAGKASLAKNLEALGLDLSEENQRKVLQRIVKLGDSKELITVEGLHGKDGGLHPVQQAMVDQHGSQCGFCTPGFVMATRAFLNKKPKATLEEIQDGLGGNICRCGTYKGITECALQIAKGGA